MIVLRYFLSVFTLLLVASLSPFCQGVVINEVDALTSENPQFVELYGSPNSGLEGHTLAMIKSVFLGGGAYGVEVYDAISLEGQSLDSEGFLWAPYAERSFHRGGVLWATLYFTWQRNFLWVKENKCEH